MSDEGKPPVPSIATSSSGLRLDSTKEIANFLGRSSRTVRRWEREEGLPVHHHYHHKKGTVYAFATEIDAWLKNRVKAGSSGNGPAPPTSLLAPVIVEASKLAVPSARPRLIAVLPFRNLTDNSAKESFADALTDEVISEIGQISPEHLRVIAYTSVAQYRQSPKSIEQIGRELGVDYVMEGGVRWHGSRVRVTARLIATRDQAQIWSESFEIHLPPMFSLQQGMARELAGALSAKLQLPVTRRPHSGTICVPAAHNAYMLGTQFFQWSDAELKKVVEIFTRAIELDPKCAPAYAELAAAWFRLGFLFNYPPAAMMRVSREFAQKALALDPLLCGGHAGMAAWNLYGAWNWSEAEASNRRAVEINPSDGRARMALAACHMVLHKLEAAGEEVRQALQLDPLSPVIGALSAVYGFLARNYDTTIEHCQKLLGPDASSPLVHLVLGICFAQKGEYARALTHCDKARALAGNEVIYTASLCSVYAAAGQRAAAEELLQELVTMTKQLYVRYIYLAQAAVGLGNDGRTLEWLEKAYEQHDPLLVFLKCDPRFEPLSGSARFRNLLGRIGIPS